MRNYNEPQVVPNVFTPEECAQIVRDCGSQEAIKGQVYHKVDGDYTQLLDTDIRNAENWVFPETGEGDFEWIRDRLQTASRKINDEYFEFSLSADHPDRLAYVHYPLDGFFLPHVDNLGSRKLMFKKLTCVVQLTPPAEYDGGELVVRANKFIAPKEVGTMIAFPTYMMHHVNRVERGTRNILVNWCVSDKHFQ